MDQDDRTPEELWQDLRYWLRPILRDLCCLLKLNPAETKEVIRAIEREYFE